MNARIFYLCLRRSIQKNQFEGSVKALENLVALTQLCVGVNCVSVMRGDIETSNARRNAIGNEYDSSC